MVVAGSLKLIYFIVMVTYFFAAKLPLIWKSFNEISGFLLQVHDQFLFTEWTTCSNAQSPNL